MNNKVLIRNYFEIGDEKSIYPASGFKRFSAKLLDIVIVNLFVFILFIIKDNVVLGSDGYLMDLSEVPIYLINGIRVDVPLKEATLLISQWDFRIILFQIASIFLWVIFLIIIPIFNFKNKGQSVGKKVFSITPLYLDGKNKTIKIILREIPFVIIFSLSSIMTLISGYEMNIIISEYYQEFNLNGELQGAGINDIMGAIGFSSFVKTMFSIQTYLTMFLFIYILVIFILLVRNPQKIAIHDKFVNEAIVDLKTIVSTNEAENRYKVLLHSNYGFVDEQQDNLDQNINNEIENIDPKLENYEDKKNVEEKDKINHSDNKIIIKQDNEKLTKSKNIDTEFKDNKNNLKSNDNLLSNENDKLSNNDDSIEDFSKLTIKEIKEILASKNIEFKSSMKKDELIELLNKNK